MDNTLLLEVILCIYAKNVQVSILVLMDIALIHSWYLMYHGNVICVSILVLMDIALIRT